MPEVRAFGPLSVPERAGSVAIRRWGHGKPAGDLRPVYNSAERELKDLDRGRAEIALPPPVGGKDLPRGEPSF